MKNLSLFLFTIISGFSYAQYTSCANAIAGAAIGNGTCLTNQNASTAVPAANCGGGFNSGAGFFYKFTAGTCPQFDITFNANEEVQYLLWNSSCGLLAAECSQAFANVPITESYSSATNAGPILTPGTTYVLEIVTRTVSNFSICYAAAQLESADNECLGASGVSTSPATFYNGGNCEYSGSFNDATTSDPSAASFCAGSLENTLWTKFSPTMGSTSIQVIGSGITCGGPVCAWQFGLFSGSCVGLVPEGCISDGTSCATGPDPNSSSSVPAGGNTNYLLVWNTITASTFRGTITRNGGAAFTGAETFYLVMDGNANSDCQFNLSGVNLQVLPMELISFEVRKYSNANMINFEVGSQRDNALFTIERSTDAINWEDVKYIDGAGTTSEQLKYSYVDENFLPTTNYYRLKQTDFNGVFAYSEIEEVNNSKLEKKVVRMVNTLGQDVDKNYKGLIIYIFDDMTTKKGYNPFF